MSFPQVFARSVGSAASSCSRRNALLAAKPVRAGLTSRALASPQSNVRAFTCTARASDANDSSNFDFNKIAAALPGIEKVRNSPKAKQALEKLMQALEKNGVNLKSGTPPGMLQMAKVAMSSEVRSAGQTAIEALKEVGIDVSPSHLASVLSGGGADQSATEKAKDAAGAVKEDAKDKAEEAKETAKDKAEEVNDETKKVAN